MWIASNLKAVSLAAISIVCALQLSGCGNGPAEGSQSPDSDINRLADVAVAIVDGSSIYDSDVDRVALEQGILLPGESLSPNDNAYRGVLDELVDQRLLRLRAQSTGLDKSAQALRRLAVSRELILGNVVVEEHLANTVTEAEARKLYEAQMVLREDGDEVRASHVLVKTKAEADTVAKRLDKGESIAKVAFELSIDQGTRLDGGDLGYFQADAMTPEFSRTVFALKVGETSPPFETEFGWHVASLVDRRAAPKLSFEDMRDEIINYLTYDSIKGLLESLREGAEVEILVDDISDAGQDLSETSTISPELDDVPPNGVRAQP